MHDLRLQLPTQSILDARELDPAPHLLTGWIEVLRTGDFEESASSVIELLNNYNRCQIEPAVRFNSAELLGPIARDIVATLQERLIGSSFPLSGKRRARSELVARLHAEMAVAYKHVVHDLAGDEKNYALSRDVFARAIYRAIHYLSASVLTAYLAYVPEPDGVWGELHRLYRFAELHNLHAIDTGAGGDGADNKELRTINHAYKRVVLLFLANPYHLMSGEAATIYESLNQWGTYGRLLTVDRVPSLEGKYFVDLDGEQPPQFALHYHMPSSSSTVRVLDVGPLVATIAAMVKKYADAVAATDGASISFKERIRRDMLQRLERAWGGRRERKDERMPNAARIVMAAGLSAAHYFVSGEMPFTPEKDEVRFHRPEGIKAALTLVPLEEQHWKRTETIDKIEAGVTKSRMSDFEGADDLWEKIYATKTRANAYLDESEPDFTAQLWSQVNGSSGGMGVSCDGRGKRVRVGDLAVYKDTKEIKSHWHVGIVRWLRDMADNNLEIGVMSLRGNVYSIAVRSIGGVGSGGEYFRSLLLRDGKTKTLLLPCAIYDIGTRLVLNSVQSITYVRLTRILEATASFSQFEYESIATPLSEQQNIDAIKSA